MKKSTAVKGSGSQSSGDRNKGERRYRTGRESHREGWSGANEALNVPFLLHNLSDPTEWPSSLG